MNTLSLTVDKFPDVEIKKYEEIRPLIRTGDVLLCSGRGFFARMIRYATDSIWSHVGLIVRVDAIDRIIVMESLEPVGVRAVSLSKYLNDYDSQGNPYRGGLVIIRHKAIDNLEPNKLKKFTQKAVDFLGYPYDKDEIAKIALRITARKLGLPKEELEKIEADHEFICSEYVARCYEELGVEIEWDRLGFIAPVHFAMDKNFSLVAVLKRPDGDDR